MNLKKWICNYIVIWILVVIGLSLIFKWTIDVGKETIIENFVDKKIDLKTQKGMNTLRQDVINRYKANETEIK